MGWKRLLADDDFCAPERISGQKRVSGQAPSPPFLPVRLVERLETSGRQETSPRYTTCVTIMPPHSAAVISS